jgi:hypothetical protein
MQQCAKHWNSALRMPPKAPHFCSFSERAERANRHRFVPELWVPRAVSGVSGDRAPADE